MRFLRYALIAVLLFLVGCMKVEESELYGSYFVKYPFGSELLEINKDYTYRQVAIIYDKADTIIHTGKWKNVPEFGDIRLRNGLAIVGDFCRLDSNYAQPFDGDVLRTYYKYFPWSNIRLTASCEGYHFEKIE